MTNDQIIEALSAILTGPLLLNQRLELERVLSALLRRPRVLAPGDKFYLVAGEQCVEAVVDQVEADRALVGWLDISGHRQTAWLPVKALQPYN